MKVVGISDLHGTLIPPENMPEGDVLCICGDIMPLNKQSDTLESISWLCRVFFKWVEELPYAKVFLVFGNHDFIGQFLRTDKNGNHRNGGRVAKKLLAPSKLTILDDSEYIYEGKRFYGSSWCPDLARWAYYADSETLTQKFSKIPVNTDVLLTHCAPRIADFGTVLQRGTYNWMSNYGCAELADAIHAMLKRPKLHLFGHIHSGSHQPTEINGVTYCNVSLKDENYKEMYPPKVFEI